MATKTNKRLTGRLKRAQRVRRAIRGTSDKPRLSVFKSNQHLSAQIIDDEKGITLVGVSTNSKEYRGGEFGRKSQKAATHLGKELAEKAKEKGVATVIFDRGPYKYHGLLAALADSAREGGLKF